MARLTPSGKVYVLLEALEAGELISKVFRDLRDLVKKGFRPKEEVYLEALKNA
ncbi:MAG: hypothetical protein QXD04_02035 [Candidatus Bathyarchaeia archaeon]|nr:hypothetical protein [Candidatus Bathyarchaeota archaeon]